MPWLRVDGPEAAAALADAIDAAPRLPQPGATAIGDGMAAGLALLARCPAPATRLAMDVSGDGRHNQGRAPGPVRDIGVAAGVTINGLAVLNEEPDLLEHYLEEVIGGPGSLAMDCPDYAAFAEAIRRKLLREIGGLLLLGTMGSPLRSLKVPVHVVLIPGPGVQTRPGTRRHGAGHRPLGQHSARPMHHPRAVAGHHPGGIEGVHATLPLQGCGPFYH